MISTHHFFGIEALCPSTRYCPTKNCSRHLQFTVGWMFQVIIFNIFDSTKTNCILITAKVHSTLFLFVLRYFHYELCFFGIWILCFSAASKCNIVILIVFLFFPLRLLLFYVIMALKNLSSSCTAINLNIQKNLKYVLKKPENKASWLKERIELSQ